MSRKDADWFSLTCVKASASETQMEARYGRNRVPSRTLCAGTWMRAFGPSFQGFSVLPTP
eukprot:1303161-Prymnesium_polylepis.1